MNIFDSYQTRAKTLIDIAVYNSIINGTESPINHIDRKTTITKWRKQLELLKAQPLLKQRTTEWYEARKSRLTASDLEEAVSDANIRLAKKKAGIVADTTNYTTIPPLKWGTMFEAMAIRCYSQEREDINIHEFGLLPDPDLEHFGASPDGINDMGIMIEIKCPYSRTIIDNSIPYKYYMQIQGQLAVCKLEECDYIECDFKVYDSPYVYIDDIFNSFNNATKNHGIIAEYKNKKTEEYVYLYSAPYLTATAAHDDIKAQMSDPAIMNNGDLLFLKLTPWRLKMINVQRITFDKALWDVTVPKINAFWNKVEECRNLPREEVIPKNNKITFIEDNDS
jgi:putative phage-type endonuclease